MDDELCALCQDEGWDGGLMWLPKIGILLCIGCNWQLDILPITFATLILIERGLIDASTY